MTLVAAKAVCGRHTIDQQSQQKNRQDGNNRANRSSSQHNDFFRAVQSASPASSTHPRRYIDPGRGATARLGSGSRILPMKSALVAMSLLVQCSSWQVDNSPLPSPNLTRHSFDWLFDGTQWLGEKIRSRSQKPYSRGAQALIEAISVLSDPAERSGAPHRKRNPQRRNDTYVKLLT